MKIDGKSALTPMAAPAREVGASRGGASEEAARAPAVRASLSSTASFVQSLRDEAASTEEPFRQSAVDEMRALLQAGTFDQAFDMDRVVDSMLADL